MMSGLSFLEGRMSLYGINRGLEALFLERRPYDGSGSFVFVPRNAERARLKLFQMDEPAAIQRAFKTTTMQSLLGGGHALDVTAGSETINGSGQRSETCTDRTHATRPSGGQSPPCRKVRE